jgi:hypothetical protein
MLRGKEKKFSDFGSVADGGFSVALDLPIMRHFNFYMRRDRWLRFLRD